MRLPGQQVIAAGVADDTALGRIALIGSGGDEHVPAVAAGVGEDPRVAPHLLARTGQVQPLVPSLVGFKKRLGPDSVQVMRSSEMACPSRWTRPCSERLSPV